MTNQDKWNEIVDRYYADPAKRAVLDDFFRELMETGEIDKTIVTAHGTIHVVDGKPKK